MAGIHWYIVRTPPAKEPAAAHVLKTRGYHVYAPMRQVWRRICRHNKIRSPERRQFALFPSYVFCGLGADTPDGEALRDTPYVTGLVTVDGVNPAEVRGQIIDEMRARFGEMITGPKFHRWMAGKEFSIGDIVELVGDINPALRGVAFKVEAIRGRHVSLASQYFGVGTVLALLDNVDVRS